MAVSWTVLSVHAYYPGIPAYRPSAASIVWAVVAGPVLGLGGMAFVWLLGNGRDIGENVFLGGLAPATLAALLVLKPLVTAMCWGSGARGGMFTPATSYGALLGALLGRLWSLLWPASPAGSYAVVGAIAVLSAAMAAPVSAVVLMVELTGGTAIGVLVPGGR